MADGVHCERGVLVGEARARVIAAGQSRATGRSFNLAVAFERRIDADGNELGRGVAESSFHHFVDYNWDTTRGCPSFVDEPPGNAVRRRPELLEDVKAYVRNLAFWLAPLRGESTRVTGWRLRFTAKKPEER